MTLLYCFAVYNATITILLQYSSLMRNTARYVCSLFGYLFEVLSIPKPIYLAALLFYFF